MSRDDLLLGLGFLGMIGLVILLFNPPTKWVKRIFSRKSDEP
jgi:hypothetical protein